MARSPILQVIAVTVFSSIFLLWQTGLYAQVQPDSAFEKMVQSEMIYRSDPSLSFRSLNTANYDLTRLVLEWTVDPSVFYITGRVTAFFKPTAAGFDQIYFDLNNNLTVTQVLYKGTACTFEKTAGHELRINLGETLPPGVEESVVIDYHGAPVSSGFGSFTRTKVCSNTYDAVWTLSEPYGARDWWPCKQDLNDKIDEVDIFVTVPAPHKVASNGVLVSTVPSGSDLIYHWKHQYPIPAYLIAIAISEYSVYSDYVSLSGGGQLEILNYIYPCNLAAAQASTPGLASVMLLFIDKFGAYPFADEKYGHANFGWGGGMEHTTMSFMGGFSHLLMSHELAHQWFGDQVTCQSWADIWLNEGFATYLEGLTYENGLGPNTWTNWKQQKIDHVTSAPDGSVWVDDTTSVSRIFSGRLSYSKGALLLHMLRWKMGDTGFFQAVNNYLNDPGLAYGYASTDDLKNHLEAVSGMDLTEFFNDWYYGQGYPTYTVAWSQDEHHNLTVQLFQDPSHSSVSFFEMPVPIRFSGSGKDQTFIFDHTSDGQVFTESLDFSVEEVVFDPDRWLIAKSGVVLPVELTGFEVERVAEDVVKATWNIEQAYDFSHFELERSFDGRHFEWAGTVAANGATQHRSEYSLFDYPAVMESCTLYYRLKMVNQDQTYHYSGYRSVTVNGNAGVYHIYPNPGKNGRFTLQLPGESTGKIRLDLYDRLGRIVRHWELEVSPAAGTLALDVEGMVPGLYFLRITDGVKEEVLSWILNRE